jgi:hypothetical protein
VSQEPLPKDLPEPASQLGDVVHAYKAEPPGCVLDCVLFSLLAGGLFFLYVGYMVVTDPGTRPSERWMGYACMAGMATPILMLFVWMRQRLYGMGTMAVWEMAGGLAWSSEAGKGAVRWEDLTKFYEQRTKLYRDGSHVGDFVRLWVHTAAGAQAMFAESLPGIADLAERIGAETLKRQLPAARAAIEGGATASFGALGVSPDGLVQGGETLAWNQVAKAWVAGGSFRVMRKSDGSNFVDVQLSDIPNVRVLLTLVHAAVGVQ